MTVVFTLFLSFVLCMLLTFKTHFYFAFQTGMTIINSPEDCHEMEYKLPLSKPIRTTVGVPPLQTFLRTELFTFSSNPPGF